MLTQIGSVSSVIKGERVGKEGEGDDAEKGKDNELTEMQRGKPACLRGKEIFVWEGRNKRKTRPR